MFSICIPNYNYEKYLGSTLDSIFSQTETDFEITVADNCSTDNSMQIVERYRERNPGKVKYKINPVNLGFSGNLDQAASLATRKYMIMLSSDDRMNSNALAVYKSILEKIGQDKRVIICSANDIIDPIGNVIRSPRASDFRFKLWQQEDIDQELTQHAGVNVYSVKPNVMLQRSLTHCANPFNFCATCYSKELYHQVGGYGGGRMINPDKWFHWRIMAMADRIIFVDDALFQYRWHPGNQTAQQANSGFLKYMMDEYRNVIEMPGELLHKAGLSSHDFIQAFIKYDIFRHGMGEFSKGHWLKSFRIYLFGWSTFPQFMLRGYSVLFLILLLTTPIGSFLSSLIRKR